MAIAGFIVGTALVTFVFVAGNRMKAQEEADDEERERLILEEEEEDGYDSYASDY